jgi:hypothetical protein
MTAMYRRCVGDAEKCLNPVVPAGIDESSRDLNRNGQSVTGQENVLGMEDLLNRIAMPALNKTTRPDAQQGLLETPSAAVENCDLAGRWQNPESRNAAPSVISRAEVGYGQ